MQLFSMLFYQTFYFFLNFISKFTYFDFLYNYLLDLLLPPFCFIIKLAIQKFLFCTTASYGIGFFGSLNYTILRLNLVDNSILNEKKVNTNFSWFIS